MRREVCSNAFRGLQYKTQAERHIHLRIISTCRFAINFINGCAANDDVAFHFNPRRNEGQVVMNNRVRGVWQCEERTDIHPAFLTENSFEVRIMVEGKKFKVA
jgi:hypothetical protein